MRYILFRTITLSWRRLISVACGRRRIRHCSWQKHYAPMLLMLISTSEQRPGWRMQLLMILHWHPFHPRHFAKFSHQANLLVMHQMEPLSLLDQTNLNLEATDLWIDHRPLRSSQPWYITSGSGFSKKEFLKQMRKVQSVISTHITLATWLPNDKNMADLLDSMEISGIGSEKFPLSGLINSTPTETMRWFLWFPNLLSLFNAIQLEPSWSSNTRTRPGQPVWPQHGFLMYRLSKRFRSPTPFGRRSIGTNFFNMVAYLSSATTDMIEVLEFAEFAWVVLNIHFIAQYAFMTGWGFCWMSHRPCHRGNGKTIWWKGSDCRRPRFQDSLKRTRMPWT